MKSVSYGKHRIYTLISMLLIVSCIMCSCADGSDKSADVASSSAVSHAINAPGFERTVITAEREKNGEIYVHGDEGYYLLAEHGADTEMKTQKRGTCWANAAATSMESSFLVRHGKRITVDANKIVDSVYDDTHTEGIIPLKINKMDFGGNGWSIIETLSNGWGEYVLASARSGEDLSTDEIKDAIKTYGAMTTGITEVHNYSWFVDGYFTQYDPENLNDHLIAIVGWDDHFPKEYFRNTPSRDGAWITQDSQTSTDYMYVSYDSIIADCFIFELSDEYGDVESYDAGCENKIRVSDTTTVANVFHKPGTLAAVGTYISKRHENIDIKIIDEKTNEVLYEQSEAFPIKGYYTIQLDDPITVTDYRIEITYDDYAPVEGEDSDYDGLLLYKTMIDKGQSYVLIDNAWYDLAEKSTVKKLGIDFEPRNACIKAIYKK